MPRCGPLAPKLKNGNVAICNPDSDDYCCSNGGYCGSGKEFCECDGCSNYRITKSNSPMSATAIWDKLTDLVKDPKKAYDKIFKNIEK